MVDGESLKLRSPSILMHLLSAVRADESVNAQERSVEEVGREKVQKSVKLKGKGSN